MNRIIAVADCETDPFQIGRVPAPFAWGWFDGTTYREFWQDQKGFIKFLRAQYAIVYAHNGGKFDWHFLLPELNPYDDLMIINGRIARCNVGDAELRDSYNILPIPLKAYKKDDIDYAIMERNQRNKPRNRKLISAYLKSDCLYLYELIESFIHKYGVQITQASGAMAQWKKISGKKTPNSGKEFYDLIAPYYYGGRVECFESGIIDTKFSVLDINSAYPYAMLHQHPYGLEYTHFEGEYLENADFVKVECISKGAFPYRGEGNPGEFSGLRFPNDDVPRTYTVSGWEYRAALETKTIRNARLIESWLFSERTDFSEYITHFYKMRLEAQAAGDDAASLFAKLFMNGLYGKFAANPDNYKNYMVVPMDTIAGLEPLGWSFAGEIGPWGLAEAPLEEKQQRYYNVATGASITGFVRAMLWRAICDSKGVMYCDTDSIAARQAGQSIVLGKALGDWKVEGEFDRAGIAGKKLYIFRGILKNGGREIKCASKGARLTYAELWKVAAGGMVQYQAEAPTFSVTKAPTFTKRNIRYTALKRVGA